jgi:hypothetical protein
MMDDLVERKPDRGGPWIEIEILAPDGSFNPGEFENLKAGDRFRVVSPGHYAEGVVVYCESDAIRPGPEDVPGNWAIIARRLDV